LASFLKNAWYAAAWSGEVSRELFRRVIMDQAILLFRKEDGTPVAMSNRCAHRFAPLHLGKLEGDTVSCPYHGLRYDALGKCVFNPEGNQRVPAGARVQTYPLLERYGVVWIWPGDPSRADPAGVPELSFMEDAQRYTPVHGLIEVGANYRYIIDNLLDLAHVGTVHHDTLGCEAISRAKTEVRVEGDTIWADSTMVPGAPNPIWEMLWKAARGPVPGPMDHWAYSGWLGGGSVKQEAGMRPAGRLEDKGINTMAVHLLTPETERSTHYFWAIARDFRLDDAELTAGMRVGAEYAFTQQDARMLTAVQETIGDQDFWGLKPCLLPTDLGPVKVRRRMDELLAAEQAAVATA
jgi:phenylpropionate dioxygenase-like ring-hydroxylating dioxygenase large terminal subunit